MNENAIPVVFETSIPPQQIDRDVIPYKIEEQPFLRHSMMQKIQGGIKQFGSIEKFIEAFRHELEEKRMAAEYAVQSFEMRRLQMEFLEKYYLESYTKPVEGLDPK